MSSAPTQPNIVLIMADQLAPQFTGADTVTVNDADVRRARRGYYANVSYFDSKVGEIVRTAAR